MLYSIAYEGKEGEGGFEKDALLSLDADTTHGEGGERTFEEEEEEAPFLPPPPPPPYYKERDSPSV